MTVQLSTPTLTLSMTMQSVTDGWMNGQTDRQMTVTCQQPITLHEQYDRLKIKTVVAAAQAHMIVKVNMLLLTMTKMCANTHVTSSASQVLVLTVWYVLVCNRIEIFFRKAKVYNMDDVVMTC